MAFNFPQSRCTKKILAYRTVPVWQQNIRQYVFKCSTWTVEWPSASALWFAGLQSVTSALHCFKLNGIYAIIYIMVVGYFFTAASTYRENVIKIMKRKAKIRTSCGTKRTKKYRRKNVNPQIKKWETRRRRNRKKNKHTKENSQQRAFRTHYYGLSLLVM